MRSCGKIWDKRAGGRPQMTVWRVRMGCWAPKATNAHTQNIKYILLFHGNGGCTNAPQCYIIRALSVLFIIMLYYCMCTAAASH